MWKEAVFIMVLIVGATLGFGYVSNMSNNKLKSGMHSYKHKSPAAAARANGRRLFRRTGRTVRQPYSHR